MRPLCFVFLIASTYVWGQPTAGTLEGNWFKTDGSNEFYFGVSPKAACYANRVWTIKSLSVVGKDQQMTLALGDTTKVVSIATLDDNSIELRSGKERVVLKKQRTIASNYKPGKKKLQAPYIKPAYVTIRGMINTEKLKTLFVESRQVTIYYHNELTDEDEVAFGDIDENGRFETKLLLYRPQRCKIELDSWDIGSFFAQPGKSVVLSINGDVEIDTKNPDYDKVAQHIAVMGDDASFNTNFQHFLYYSTTKGFPYLNFPKDILKGSGTEKKAILYNWHETLQAQILSDVEKFYPSKSTEQRFTQFIRDEIRYTIASSLLAGFNDGYMNGSRSDFDPDSLDVAKIRKQYLTGLTDEALVHPGFYYTSAKMVDILLGIKKVRLSGPRAKPSQAMEVIRADSSALPVGYIDLFQKITRELGSASEIRTTAAEQTYFNDDKNKYWNFRTMYSRAEDEVERRAEDSIAYYYIKQRVTDPLIRYAGNLRVLSKDLQSFATPSSARLEIYRKFSQGGVGPWKQVVSLRKREQKSAGLVGVSFKTASGSIDHVNNETDWQNFLARYQGKVVVVAGMRSGGHKRKGVALRLHEINKMRTYYKGKDVVFLKVIYLRDTPEQYGWMAGDMEFLADRKELFDVYSIPKEFSLRKLEDASVGYKYMIYNDKGYLHHPREGSTNASLTREVDLVLNGNGDYFEPRAKEFFPQPGVYQAINNWTLIKQTGRYQSYSSEEPKDKYYIPGIEPDSVFQQLMFLKGDSVLDMQLLFRKVKQPGETGYKAYVYEKERGVFSAWKYTYDPEKFILTFLERSVVRKKLRIVTITNKVMIFEEL